MRPGLDYNPFSTMPPSTSSPAGPSHPGLKTQLKQFWQRMTEGLELNQLWTQFHTDARASYRLYRLDYGARARQDTQPRGFLHTAQEFLWAILEKLSPARRVLMLLGYRAPDFSRRKLQFLCRRGGCSSC